MAPTPGLPHSRCARRAKKDGETFLRSRHRAVAAEERRHVDREAGIADPVGKARDMGLMPGISAMTITADPASAT
jgi:hypothetical protein